MSISFLITGFAGVIQAARLLLNSKCARALSSSMCRRRASLRNCAMRRLRSANHACSLRKSFISQTAKQQSTSAKPSSPVVSSRAVLGVCCSTVTAAVESMLNCITRRTDREVLFFATQFDRRPAERGLAVAQFKVEYCFAQAKRAYRFDFFNRVG